MSGALRVVRPGLLTTVQDAGRRGGLRLGIPPSGAADPEGLRIANLLAGNPPGAAGLEITHSGPVLEVLCRSARLAVGGDVEVAVEDTSGRMRAISPWSARTLTEGERMHLGRVRGSLRAYLAVSGGLAVPPVLGSASTHLRAAFGGLEGRALRPGDVLPLAAASAPTGHDLRLLRPPRRSAGPLRVVPGPQDDHAASEVMERLLATAWTVSARSDRVGLRLHGPALAVTGGGFVSDGCVTGSIQVTGDGHPIVLLCDRGTTGGYPKIATVASVDLPRLGRLRPGDVVRLVDVDVAAAERLRRRRERVLARLPARLVPAGP